MPVRINEAGVSGERGAFTHHPIEGIRSPVARSPPAAGAVNPYFYCGYFA